jgi:choice-of-anchor B domain-containing protein
MKYLLLTVLAGFLTFNSFSQTPCLGGMAGGYPCENVDLLAHLTSAQLGGGEMNDIWGWTDPNGGNEYVMIGRDAGTSFVDISDPLNPVYLGVLLSHTSNSIWRDIKVYQNHAFIVSEANSHGMQVFDLTQLSSVTGTPVIFSETAFYGSFGRCHNIVINEASGFAYAVGSNTAGGGLHVIDISTPTNPVIAGLFSGEGYTHDAQVVNYIGPDTNYVGAEIAFACNEDNIAIINVTDKTDIQGISLATYPTAFYTHQGWLTEDHKYFLANDELDEINGTGNTRTFIFDVQNLDAPFLLGTYTHSTASIDHNLYVHEGYIYESNYRAGLRILESSDIANGNLSEVAFFDVYPSSNSAQFNGSWSNYPFFSSGVVAVSHIEQGLFLLKPDIKIFFADADNDGFGDPLVSLEGFTSPSGYVDNNLDCDDTLNTVYLGAPGTGENIDNNCDGSVLGAELTAQCVADFNNDGTRNILDLSALLGAFGCITDCSVDANDDGSTNVLDLSVFLGVFGIDCE